MNKQSTISINGVSYDAHTGLRLDTRGPAPTLAAPRHSSHNAHQFHQSTERTHTLSRAHVKAPTKHAIPLQRRPKTVITQSPMVKKFADIRPATSAATMKKHSNTPVQDIQPIRHPLQQNVQAVARSQSSSKTPMAAQEIKHRAIEKALKTAKPPTTKKSKRSFLNRHPRMLSVASASLALVLLAGYLTYINLPSLSVRVAAAQAGIAATYPTYQPSGYSLHGPVAYSNGQVSMQFAANVGPQNFKVNQVKSGWDSSALLDNYVQQASKGDYTTYSDSGLTIYVYGTNAAWVNGGILHTIGGDAPLSSDQIRRLATSM